VVLATTEAGYNKDALKDVPLDVFLSLCTLYLHVCQVRVTVGHSGLCCVCVTSFER